MKISCLCCTCNRPHLLAEIIECFNRQTFPPEQRELIVLDDRGQYKDLDTSNLPSNIRIISVSERFPSLGEKRNACASYASPDADVFSIWDDDDIYLPRHLEVSAALIEDGAEWVGAKYALVYCIWQMGFLELKAPDIFQGSWVYTRSLFKRVGGYQPCWGTEDQEFWRHAHARGVAISKQTAEVTYIYRTTTAMNRLGVVGYDQAGYDILGEQPTYEVSKIRPGWWSDWGEVLETAKRYFGDPLGRKVKTGEICSTGHSSIGQ